VATKKVVRFDFVDFFAPTIVRSRHENDRVWCKNTIFHVTGRQPFPQDLLIHRDIGFQPRMADSVKARLNVSFENPLGRMPCRQDDKTLSNRIGNRTLGRKP